MVTAPERVSLGGGVTQVDTGYLFPGFTAMYLVIDSGRAAFFDAGTGASLPFAQRALEAFSLDAGAVDLVIVSHAHLDHCAGAGHFARAFPAARIVAHRRCAVYLAAPARLIGGARELYGARFDDLYGEVLPVDEERILTVGEGDRLALGARELEVLDTPGHAFDQISVVDRAADCCFCGDAFGIRMPAVLGVREVMRVPSAPTQFAPETWRATAVRFAGLGVARLMVAHSGEVAGELGARARELCEELHAFEGYAREAARSQAGQQLLAKRIRDRWQEQLWPDGKEDVGTILDIDLLIAVAGLQLWMRKHMDGS